MYGKNEINNVIVNVAAADVVVVTVDIDDYLIGGYVATSAVCTLTVLAVTTGVAVLT